MTKLTEAEQIELYGEEVIATIHPRTDKGEEDVYYKSMCTWKDYNSFEDCMRALAKDRKVTFRTTAHTPRG